jgi:hypothetical protein
MLQGHITSPSSVSACFGLDADIFVLDRAV